jgi:hypothetical protein
MPSTSVLATFVGLTLCLATAASAQPTATAGSATYDPVTQVLTLPAVKVGADVYSPVTLLNVGNYTFTLQAATPQIPAGPGYAAYDLANQLLSIPAVKVGASTFVDVTLLNLGNFTFALQAATELPAATLNAAKALLASVDALWASEVPRSGELRMSLSDGCWRHDGKTRAMAVSEVDADPPLSAQRDAYRVGSTHGNLQVLAVRNRSNPDGSARQEIDVRYDVSYKDGSTVVGTEWTLISGSSVGTPGCTTPQNTAALRFLGNQRLLQTSVRARNGRDERYAASTGAALTPAVNHRRTLQWAIADPTGAATHVVVSGPGPGATVGNTALPFSLKFISPRLLRSAPELQGKSGNFLNWLDDDLWRYCRVSGSATPLASTADCVGQGAGSFELGVTTATPNAAADQAFAAQGWVLGAVYRFDIYNDDGWKTVNGHAGKTPLATYYSRLDALPYSFVEMAGSGAADKFARLSFAGLSSAQVRANAVSAAPAAMNVSWTALPSFSDGRRLVLFSSYEYHQGARLGNATGVFNPAYRWTFNSYPASTASGNPSWAVTAKPANQLDKSYFEFSLLFSDRNDLQLLSTVSFQ